MFDSIKPLSLLVIRISLVPTPYCSFKVILGDVATWWLVHPDPVWGWLLGNVRGQQSETGPRPWLTDGCFSLQAAPGRPTPWYAPSRGWHHLLRIATYLTITAISAFPSFHLSMWARTPVPWGRPDPFSIGPVSSGPFSISPLTGYKWSCLSSTSGQYGFCCAG